MLHRTFLHIHGVGECTEKRLWQAGLTTWSDFLERAEQTLIGQGLANSIRREVEASVRHFERRDWSYFDAALPAAQAWRAWGDLRGQALFVDIETLGLNLGDVITMIGAYDGHEVRTFVLGRNLDEAVAYLNAFPAWITYSGAAFDVPMIRHRFADAARPRLHIDLRYPLYRLGLKGGLKAIERRLGLVRSGETAGLGGLDAVRLWRAYGDSGNEEALRLLLAYNAEDCRNLLPLMELVYAELGRRMGWPVALPPVLPGWRPPPLPDR